MALVLHSDDVCGKNMGTMEGGRTMLIAHQRRRNPEQVRWRSQMGQPLRFGSSAIGHTLEDVLADLFRDLKKGGQRGTTFHRMAPFLVSDRF